MWTNRNEKPLHTFTGSFWITVDQWFLSLFVKRKKRSFTRIFWRLLIGNRKVIKTRTTLDRKNAQKGVLSVSIFSRIGITYSCAQLGWTAQCTSFPSPLLLSQHINTKSKFAIGLLLSSNGFPWSYNGYMSVSFNPIMPTCWKKWCQTTDTVSSAEMYIHSKPV